MSKKFIIIIAVVVVLAGAGAAYYFFFGGQDLVVRLLNNGSESFTADDFDLPEKEARAVLLSQRIALSPILSLTGGTVWYFDDTGQLYRASLSGSEDLPYGLSNIRPIQKALWPAAGNDFIVKTLKENAVIFRYYNSATSKFVDLPSNIWDLAWLPSGKQIVYVWAKPDGGKELQVSDPDASNYSKLADLQNYYILKAPSVGNYVLLQEIPVPGAANRVFKFDLESNTQELLLDRGMNIDLSISPDGTKILFTRFNEDTRLPEVWLADLAANTFQNLHLVTSIYKIAWSADGEEFYYALPQAVDPDDYLVNGSTGDELFIYDIAAAASRKLEPAGLAAGVDMRDLILAENGNALVFRNHTNGRLYKVKLK